MIEGQRDQGWVGSTLAGHATRAPGAFAVVAGAEPLTWRTLHHMVEALAHSLAVRTPAGARIALALPNRSALLCLALAAMRSGRVAMLCDPDWPAETRDRVLVATEPDLLITEKTVSVPSAIETVPPDVLKAEAADWLARAGEVANLPAPSPDALFYICFTAGSTGLPKGVARNHASWLATFKAAASVGNIGQHDHVLALGAFAHSIHFYAAMEALQAGASLSFLERFRPRHALARIEKERVTVVYGTPVQFLLLKAAAARSGQTYPSVRLLVTGGAKWQASEQQALLALFPSAQLIEFYGASETSFMTATSPQGKDGQRDGAVGTPVPGVALAIRGADGKRCPPGEVGTIWVKSDMLFSHYVCGENPDLHWRDGALSIGDLGYLDEKGALVLAGRKSRMLIIAAQNVFAEDIETQLLNHHGIDAAMIFGMADPLRGQVIIAALYAASGTEPPTDEDVRHYCRTHMAAYKIPRHIVWLDHWPVSEAGKPVLKTIEQMARERLGAKEIL